MIKAKTYKSKVILSILLIIGIGLGVYFSFILGLYRLEKKESKTIGSTTEIDSRIQEPVKVNQLIFHYLRNVK